MGLINAEVAELADAHGSGPCDSNIMRVQVPFPALAAEASYLSKLLKRKLRYEASFIFHKYIL